MNAVFFKMNNYFVALILAVITLSACDLISSPAEKVTFLDKQFSVTKPASWSLKEDLNDEADLQRSLHGSFI